MWKKLWKNLQFYLYNMNCFIVNMMNKRLISWTLWLRLSKPTKREVNKLKKINWVEYAAKVRAEASSPRCSTSQANSWPGFSPTGNSHWQIYCSSWRNPGALRCTRTCQFWEEERYLGRSRLASCFQKWQLQTLIVNSSKKLKYS